MRATLLIVFSACVELLGGCTVARRPALAPRTISVPAPTADGAPTLAEPTRASCEAAVAKSRALATSLLPPEEMSRKVAESYLMQALVEAGNGEFDDCLEYAARAAAEVKQHRHDASPR